jgi:hypothetical protein
MFDRSEYYDLHGDDGMPGMTSIDPEDEGEDDAENAAYQATCTHPRVKIILPSKEYPDGEAFCVVCGHKFTNIEFTQGV